MAVPASGAVLVAGLLAASPAWAHEVGAGQEVRVTQTFGSGEVTLVIGGGAPLRVDARAARPVRVRLSLRSLTDGSVSADSVWAGSLTDGSVTDGSVTDGSVTDGSVTDGSVTMSSPRQGGQTAVLSADHDGPYELGVGVGDEVSVIPIRVAAAGGAWWAMLGDGAVLALGLLLVGGVLAGRMSAALVGAASAAAAVAAVVMLLRPYLPSTSQRPVADPGLPYAQGWVSTLPARPAAGAAFTLTVRLTDGATGRPVDDLAVHHEALAHVVVTSQDGAFFRHVHPLRVAPGVLAVRLSVPRPGRYLVHTEMERRQSGGQLLPGGFDVFGGGSGESSAPPVSGEVVVPRLSPAVPVAGSPVTVDVAVRGPLAPWLGMPGHLIVRSEDGEQLAHVHGTAQGASALRFTFTLPRAGRYLAWVQCLEAGELVTRSFTVEVER
ncbi:hypothetical protein GCM10022248_85060 [Nonomuraea soli]